MNEALKPRVETMSVDGVTLHLARHMTVGSYEEQMEVVSSPAYNPSGVEKGKLMPIGGVANDRNFQLLAGEVIEGTGVTVISFPTMFPEKRYDDVASPLRAHGVEGSIFHIPFDLLPDIGAMMMDRSSLIMTTGGDQVRGRELFKDLGLDRKLIESRDAGKSVAGTSAGSHLMGEKMPYVNIIVDGLGMTKMGIDTHFGQQDRYKRQEEFVSVTDAISVGLDEATGIVYEKGMATVFGDGEAVVRFHNGQMEKPIVLHEGESVNVYAINKYISPFQLAA